MHVLDCAALTLDWARRKTGQVCLPEYLDQSIATRHGAISNVIET